MDERWLAVVDFEGLYEVSDLGRVRTVGRVIIRSNGRPHTVKSCIRKAKTVGKGYRAVTLVRDAQMETQTVHHLVLHAFVGARPDEAVCRHLNGLPSDNRLENLTWGTPSENMLDKRRHGTDHQVNK